MFTSQNTNSVFVFTPSIESMYDVAKYYPGDNYVDWIGYGYFGEIIDGDYPDFFSNFDYVYKSFDDKKPIIISCYALSHYTKTTNTYFINKFKNNIDETYKRFEQEYPRVKAINYFDVDGTSVGKRYKNDNFSITSNEELLKIYNTSISSDYFLSKMEPGFDKQLVSTNYVAYKFDNIIYMSRSVLINELGLSKVMIDNYDYVVIEEEKYYAYEDVVKMGVTSLFVDEKNHRIYAKK